MFCPDDRHMERGWVGRIEDDRVVHLAAQTLQHFFTGGASAREHAEYPLETVTLLAPVPHPPSIRIFEDGTSFAFANPAAILGPDREASAPAESILALPRLAGVIGADGTVAGVTLLLELRAHGIDPPKDRDFALGLGPVVVTTDELLGSTFELVVRVDGKERLAVSGADVDWEAMRRSAAAGTTLRTGDLLAGAAPGRVEDLPRGARVTVDVSNIGVLSVAVT
jgi:hypothetical protein